MGPWEGVPGTPEGQRWAVEGTRERVHLSPCPPVPLSPVPACTSLAHSQCPAVLRPWSRRRSSPRALMPDCSGGKTGRGRGRGLGMRGGHWAARRGSGPPAVVSPRPRVGWASPLGADALAPALGGREVPCACQAPGVSWPPCGCPHTPWVQACLEGLASVTPPASALPEGWTPWGAVLSAATLARQGRHAVPWEALPSARAWSCPSPWSSRSSGHLCLMSATGCLLRRRLLRPRLIYFTGSLLCPPD